jgi:hypothetical protein
VVPVTDCACAELAIAKPLATASAVISHFVFCFISLFLIIV